MLVALRRAAGRTLRAPRRSLLSTSAAATDVCDNPYTLTPHCETPQASATEACAAVDAAAEAQRAWAARPLAERAAVCAQFCDVWEQGAAGKHADHAAFVDAACRDISSSMGKPLAHARGEVGGMLERARAMIDLAPVALASRDLPKAQFARRIVREPVGIVVVIAPWNYPLLTAVNAVMPALLAGNGVVIKHSERTPNCGRHFVDALHRAGCPDGLVQAVQCEHDVTAAALIQHPRTGSVGGGRAVFQTAAAGGESGRFVDTTLELGGKDALYCAADADIQAAAAGAVDGAMFNAGQSCCGIERAYVHEDVYDAFLAAAHAALTGGDYVLGDPADPSTTMGPMAQPGAPSFLEGQVADAVAKGATLLCGGSATTDAAGLGRFFQPTLLADCDHSMSAMVDESFGPLLAVQKVSGDDEAVRCINDSQFGLTAALFTRSQARATALAPQIETGVSADNPLCLVLAFTHTLTHT